MVPRGKENTKPCNNSRDILIDIFVGWKRNGTLPRRVLGYHVLCLQTVKLSPQNDLNSDRLRIPGLSSFFLFKDFCALQTPCFIDLFSGFQTVGFLRLVFAWLFGVSYFTTQGNLAERSLCVYLPWEDIIIHLISEVYCKQKCS